MSQLDRMEVTCLLPGRFALLQNRLNNDFHFLRIIKDFTEGKKVFFSSENATQELKGARRFRIYF